VRRPPIARQRTTNRTVETDHGSGPKKTRETPKATKRILPAKKGVLGVFRYLAVGWVISSKKKLGLAVSRCKPFARQLGQISIAVGGFRGFISMMRNKKAFTLIELLTVIAVIAILAAISFGVTTGVYQRQARTQASADLSAISTALESYRKQYRSYPEVSIGASAQERGNELFLALANLRGPRSSDTPENTTEVRPFLEFGKVESSGPESTDNQFDPTSGTYHYIDPWGNPYEYGFTIDPGQTTWKRFGFIIFSNGPDGVNQESGITASGLPDRDAAANLDNIYVGE